jgi:hypothetical protein
MYLKALEQRPSFYEGFNSLAILESDEGNVATSPESSLLF